MPHTYFSSSIISSASAESGCNPSSCYGAAKFIESNFSDMNYLVS